MKNKIIFSCLTFAALYFAAGCAGNFNLSGQWQGKMIQRNGPRGESAYVMSYNLTQVDSTVSGISRIEIPETPYYAEMKLKGTIKNDTLYFDEIKILKQNEREGYFWCLKKGTLKINVKNKEIEGKWASSDCTPGVIYMAKVH